MNIKPKIAIKQLELLSRFASEMSLGTNQYNSRGIFWSLFLIIVTFPLPYKISNLGLVALVIVWLFNLIAKSSKNPFNLATTSQKVTFFSFISFFAWQIIALSYTTDQYNGWKNVESTLTLLILPLIFYSIQLTQGEIKKLILAYVYSINLSSIILSAQSFYSYFTTGRLLTYHNFTQLLDSHAVFYSYNLFLSILLSAFLLASNKLSKINRRLVRVSILISAAGLIMSASKNVLAVTTIFLFAGYLLKLIKEKFSIREFTVLVVGVIVVGLIYINIPSIGNRIKELGEINGIETYEKVKAGKLIDHKDLAKFNGTTMRLTFWYVAITKQFREGKMWFGYSPGDRRAVINEEFFRVGLNPGYENYNLHNQFIQTLVELGLIGLVLYLFIYLGIAKSAYDNKNYLLLIFLIGICFFQLTESIIERNKGIVFIVFFLLFLEKVNPKLNENRDNRY